MTALVAVLNKNAVALAADRAITSTKIHNSANKLFTLSKFEPIGIMVYGAAEFMGIPWETVIKMYRARLGETRFFKLQDYADDFLQYLRTEELIVPATKQGTVVEGIIRSTLHELREKVRETVSNRTSADPDGLSESEVPQLVESVSRRALDAFAPYSRLSDLSEDDEKEFVRENAGRVETLAHEVFQQLPIDHVLDLLARICCYRITRDYWSAHSGLVFAGFGTRDVLPVVAYRVPHADDFLPLAFLAPKLLANPCCLAS